MHKPNPFERFIEGYKTALLFTEVPLTDWDGEYEETADDQGFQLDDFTDGAEEQIREICSAFWDSNAEDLAEFMEVTGRGPEDCGHDFLFTRGGHGVGFWDRGAGDVGDRLSKASEPYGETHLFKTEDNRLEVED